MSTYATDAGTIASLADTPMREMPDDLRRAVQACRWADAGLTSPSPWEGVGMTPRYAWLRRAYVREAIGYINSGKPLPEPRNI